MKPVFNVFFSIVSLVLFSGTSFARIEGPCSEGVIQNAVQLNNSDDLFSAGYFLGKSTRSGSKRIAAGVQCLNLGKKQAPDYLDIRLQLMNAFANIGDKKSGRSEAGWDKFELSPFNLGFAIQYFSDFSKKDYSDTYYAYNSKIERIETLNSDWTFEDAHYEYVSFSTPLEGALKKLNGDSEVICDFDKLKSAVVDLKFHDKMLQAADTLNWVTYHDGPDNLNSPTTHFYLGLVNYDLEHDIIAQGELSKALKLSGGHDLDVILAFARALKANAYEVKFEDTRAQTLHQAKMLQVAETLLKVHYSDFVAPQNKRIEGYGCLQYAQIFYSLLTGENPRAAEKLLGNMLDGLMKNEDPILFCRYASEAFLD